MPHMHQSVNSFLSDWLDYGFISYSHVLMLFSNLKGFSISI